MMWIEMQRTRLGKGQPGGRYEGHLQEGECEREF
jgi:hypothetical protein